MVGSAHPTDPTFFNLWLSVLGFILQPNLQTTDLKLSTKPLFICPYKTDKTARHLQRTACSRDF